ncbi:MAG TPA: NAD-dependent succinate-semialdehyde dehydrogenase [Verrucomicrobiae bacterium]|jgi:succinate-semialdehyde dehydrogenase/glutarate-semialdehyde dehydrogenase
MQDSSAIAGAAKRISANALQSIDPATGELVGTYPEHSDAAVIRSLELAATAQRAWREQAPAVRAALRRASNILRRDKEQHAILMAREMGKPAEQGRAEIDKCALCCEYFAEHAGEFLAPTEIKTEFERSYVLFQPLGVLLAVMPWNFPFWQVIRAAAPALMSGNAVVLKHASNVSGCALAIESVFREAELPHGLFSTLLVPSKRVAQLIAHPVIAAVTLTGSTEAGQKVAAAAGANLKKTVLELGGSDAYVVLEDADVETAVETCVTSRLINSGQSCIAAKRFIVVSAARKKFEQLFVEKMRARKVGLPLEAGTQVGPLARHDLRDALDEQVQRSVQAGARAILGGQRPEGAGAFYPPTVLTDVLPGMAAFDEETFGPVAAIIEAADEEAAIALANHSSFGLGAAVFTRDRQRGERVAARLEAGCCFVNDFVRSDPRLPFGGIKQSGYGRELGILGIREFVNAKTVCVR